MDSVATPQLPIQCTHSTINRLFQKGCHHHTNFLTYFKGSHEQVCHCWSSTKATRVSHYSKWVIPQLIFFWLLMQSFIFSLHIFVTSCISQKYLHVGREFVSVFSLGLRGFFFFTRRCKQNEEATTWQQRLTPLPWLPTLEVDGTKIEHEGTLLLY